MNKKKDEYKKPKFQHDCTKCIYLGTTAVRIYQNRKLTLHYVDHYICGRTVLARYSNKPSDYTSTSCGYAVSGSDLSTSVILAIAKGLLKVDKDFQADLDFYVSRS